MTLERVRELMTIEQECVKRANTCGRDCAKCDLVQDDKDLIEAYDVIQIVLITMEHFQNALEDIDDYARNTNRRGDYEVCSTDSDKR